MVPVDLGLRDRTYIVTGASAGLGFATAKALAAEGARLVISSRNEESITRTEPVEVDHSVSRTSVSPR